MGKFVLRHALFLLWLYLPKGSRRITLKHPRWGVWRDYSFPSPLKGKCTYELVVNQPREVSSLPPLGNPIGIRVEPTLDTRIEYQSPMKPHVSALPWQLFGMLMCGVTEWDQPSLGMRIGIVRKHGFYLSVQTDLHALPSTDGDCNRYGIPPGQTSSSYDTGKKSRSRIMCSLRKILNRKVDLVEEDCLLPFAVESVNQDKILIYERSN